MDNPETLKKKLGTVHDLLSIVKTMKGLAAVNIRHYEKAVTALEEYDRAVRLGWRALFPLRGSLNGSRPGKATLMLVIGSDQGMCGQFNDLACRLALETLEELESAPQAIRIWSIGARARYALEDAGKPTQAHFHLPGGIPGVNALVQRLVRDFESLRRKEHVETLYIVHNRQTGSIPGPVARRLLPLDQDWLASLKADPWPTKALPRLEADPETLFKALFRQYFLVSLHRALAESMASENSARLNAMQAAEKNIIELEENLQATYREVRQNTITAELLDIVSGFEALS